MADFTRLMSDLDGVIARGTAPERARDVQRLADLFRQDDGRLTDDQVIVFDDVIGKHAPSIETRARAALSERLADGSRGPPRVVRALAHDDVTVARHVLARSPCLTDDDLVSVADSKGPDHMLAICERPTVSARVTDVLVFKGDVVVRRAVAGHPRARLSDRGAERLVDTARDDEILQDLLGRRRDLPDRHIRTLVAAAKETARRRIAEGEQSLSFECTDSDVVSAQRTELADRYSRALDVIRAVRRRKPLTEGDLLAIARSGRFEETVCIFAYLACLPLACVDRIFAGRDDRLILIVGRGRDWSWRTVRILVEMYGRARQDEMQLVERRFESLKSATAERVMQALRSGQPISGTHGPGRPDPKPH